ncbi:MAG: hypothetical protein K940chlam8_00103 [Chlamydiae bacterium]|nr:hypothetical protein [Chlamydiota bacterium]
MCKIVGVISSVKDKHSQFLQMGPTEKAPFLLGDCLFYFEDCASFESSDENYTLILKGTLNVSFDAFLELYKTKKEQGFNSLEGDFFFLFFDRKLKTQYFMRSKQCLMPFYWSEKKDFLFSNTLKALCSCQSIAKKIDPFAIKAYLHLGFIPSPYTPIQNVNELLPGYLLTYQGKRRISLMPIDHKESRYTTQKIPSLSSPSKLSWKTLLEEIYFLEHPISILFFSDVLRLKPSVDFVKQPIELPSIKHLPKLKKPLPKSKLFSWFSLWFLKQRHRGHMLLDFENSPYCFFTTDELEYSSKALEKTFDLSCYLIKYQSEYGLTKSHIERIYTYQNTLFAFANRHKEKNTEHCDTKELITHFLTTQEHLEQSFTPKMQEEAKTILMEGVLFDLDIIDRRLINNLEVAKAEHIPKIWNLIILELWFRIFIEKSPSLENLAKIEENLHTLFQEKTQV